MANGMLNVGLDLGGDTLKITFAYEEAGKVRYGKIVGERDLLQIALPAVAYYDICDGRWYFADEIERKRPEEYVTVVKIKSLIAMLSAPQAPTEEDVAGTRGSAKKKDALKKEWERRLAVWQSNKRYYFEENRFPKFYFPVKRELLQDFDRMVELDMTFSAAGHTPHEVCAAYFRHVRALVDRRRAELEAKIGRSFEGYRISLVHAARVGEEYLEELSVLLEKTFGEKPYKVLSTNKALALYAKHRGDAAEGERFLVFDLGEESISVVQAAIVRGQVTIDGVEGHSRPAEIGGNDVDEAIVRRLEERVFNRETLGTPSAGEEGHIREESAYGKQYMLMKDVKKAKTVFSKPRKKQDLFADGVPVTLRREVLVQCRLTKEDVEASIGVTGGTGIAEQIAAYVCEEVKRPINRGVKRIFISGGVTETFGLLDFIKSYLKKKKCAVTVCTFDDGVEKGDAFSILSHEDSVFAASVGGAIVSLLDIDVKTVFSLSYASWVNPVSGSEKCLAIFANRGDPIDKNGTERYLPHFGVGGRGVNGEEMYSVIWTEDDVVREAKKSSSVSSAASDSSNVSASSSISGAHPSSSSLRRTSCRSLSISSRLLASRSSAEG